MKRERCEQCGKGMLDGRRYRLEPLAQLVGETVPKVCRIAGVSGETEINARCHGVLRDTADRMAVRCGEHPYVIWPEMQDHDVEDHEVECACDGCEVRFIPAVSWQKFCCAQCRRRTEIRRERATPAGKARNRATAKKWRETTRDYRRRYHAQWRERNGDRINAERRRRRENAA